MMYYSKHGSCQHQHKGHRGRLVFLQKLYPFPKEKSPSVMASLRGYRAGTGLGHIFLSPEALYGDARSMLSHLLCCLGSWYLHFSAPGQKHLPVTARQRDEICPGPVLSYS